MTLKSPIFNSLSIPDYKHVRRKESYTIFKHLSSSNSTQTRRPPAASPSQLAVIGGPLILANKLQHIDCLPTYLCMPLIYKPPIIVALIINNPNHFGVSLKDQPKCLTYISYICNSATSSINGTFVYSGEVEVQELQILIHYTLNKVHGRFRYATSSKIDYHVTLFFNVSETFFYTGRW